MDASQKIPVNSEQAAEFDHAFKLLPVILLKTPKDVMQKRKERKKGNKGQAYYLTTSSPAGRIDRKERTGILLDDF